MHKHAHTERCQELCVYIVTLIKPDTNEYKKSSATVTEIKHSHVNEIKYSCGCHIKNSGGKVR